MANKKAAKKNTGSNFDIKKFESTQFLRRTEDVEILTDVLKQNFCKDKNKPLFFKVQGLDGNEIAKCENSKKRAEIIRAAVDAIESHINQASIKDGISDFLLGDKDLEDSLKTSIEMVSLGCVEPKLDHQLSVKLHKVAPVDAKNLRNKILVLSGKGFDLGEPQASGGGRT